MALARRTTGSSSSSSSNSISDAIGWCTGFWGDNGFGEFGCRAASIDDCVGPNEGTFRMEVSEMAGLPGQLFVRVWDVGASSISLIGGRNGMSTFTSPAAAAVAE